MSNQKPKPRRMWGAIGVAMVAVIAGATGVKCQDTHPEPPAASVSAAPAGVVNASNFGVVDYKKLLAAHKDAKNLSILDSSIERLSQELNTPREVDPKLKKRVEQQIKELEASFNQRMRGEQDAATAEMRQKQEAANAELQGLAAKMDQDLKQQIKSLPKEPVSPQLPANFNSRKSQIDVAMKSYMDDLLLIRQRQLASRRIELQRNAEQSLNGLKTEMNRELDAYEAQLQAESQEQKVNLELQKTIAKTDDDRQKIEDQLNAIKSTQESKRQARRTELAAKFDTEQKAALAKVDVQLQAYQAKIDTDAHVKVAQEQQRLVHTYFPNAPLPGTQPVAGPPPQIKHEIEAIKDQQAKMKAAFEQRKNELMGGLKAENEAMAARLTQRAADMKKEFNEQAKAIIAKATQEAGTVPKEDQAKLANIKKDLTDLQAQRQRLYEQMQADLEKQVGVVAKKDNVPVVVGFYVVKGKNIKDLTAEVLQAMGQ